MLVKATWVKKQGTKAQYSYWIVKARSKSHFEMHNMKAMKSNFETWFLGCES